LANAEFLGRGKDLGSIKAGKLADMIMVDASPLEDIRNIRRVSGVIKNGKVLDISYHSNYSIPIQTPAITRPTWLDRELAAPPKAKGAKP
ncbi:MAG TPA: amidohydrolase family protein, partial [Blastocatellia bacterium]|nr:amidohydrolase family protein [Blastocatellia bacterium]